MNKYMDSGFRILAWRQRHKWNQMQAAGHLDMPYHTYVKREQGRNPAPGIMFVAMRGLDAEFPIT